MLHETQERHSNMQKNTSDAVRAFQRKSIIKLWFGVLVHRLYSEMSLLEKVQTTFFETIMWVLVVVKTMCFGLRMIWMSETYSSALNSLQ